LLTAQTFNREFNCEFDTDCGITSVDPLSIGDVFIYPNPCIDEFYITTIEALEVSIVDIQGKVLIRSKDKWINVSALSNGLYIAVVKIGDKVFYLKFIKI
jgi:hypothetical protein